jgi:YD repeat-containing protein
MNTPENISVRQTTEPCGVLGEATMYSIYNTKVFHSNSINNLYDYNDGNPVYYKSIIESDDSLFRNGGTEYTYPPVDDGSRTSTLTGEAPIGVPVGQSPTLFGRVIRQVVFNSDFDTLQCTKYNYDMAINMDHYVPSFYVNKNSIITASDPNRLDAFDVIEAFYSSNWIRPETQINIVYDGPRRLIDTIKYFYGTFDNVLPQRIVTKNSKNEVTERRIHYATDYPASTVAQKMCLNNQVEQPLEDSVLKQNTLLKYYKAEYKDWFNNAKILSPNYIYAKESPADAITQKILYNVYDTKGNILELQKANDVKEVYLWGYDTTYPVAKITGSDYATVSTVVTQAQIDAASGSSGSDAALRTLLQNLRTNAATKNALITTYTYIPFVGVSSVTDPSGRTTYYEYDGFSRLHIIKDKDGNIIKKIEYKYANQPEN